MADELNKPVDSFLSRVRTFLQGKKTYVVGVGAIVGATVAWASGELTNGEVVSAVVAALMGMFIRAGVGNEIKKNIQ